MRMVVGSSPGDTGHNPRCDVFFNTPGACHVPGLPEERCGPMSREPALEVGERMPADSAPPPG
eukprot:4971127-Prymnesium_polylepis.1